MWLYNDISIAPGQPGSRISGIMRESGLGGETMYRLALFFLFFIVSCSGAPLVQSNFSSMEPFRNPGHAVLSNGSSIAILTVMGTDRGQEQKTLLVDFVSEAIKKRNPRAKVVPYWEGLNIINSEGHTADYSQMMHEYLATGILNKHTLSHFGEMLGVTYFIQPRLADFSQGASTRFSLLGLTLFKTHESHIKLYFEVWEASTGRIVWVGSTEANMASEHYKSKPIPFEDIARYAVDNLVLKMP